MFTKIGLQDQVALITGAGQPLADAVARRFAAAGARLALVYLPGQAEGASRLAETMGAALLLECDPGDPEAVRSTVRAVQALGGIDVLVNTAIVRANGPAHTLSLTDWQRVIDVELSGTVYFCREVIRYMLRKKSGRIINLTDVTGMRGEAGGVNHAASRGGVAALTRALASELAPLGIYVNALAVGYMTHEFGDLPLAGQERLLANTPLGRPGTADEVAEAALFLASGVASFTTGALLQVNGGLYL